MVVKGFVTLFLVLLTTNLIGQDSLKLKLPPIWLNSLYLKSTIADGVEHFVYTYQDKKLKSFEYSILLRKESQKKESEPAKNKDFHLNEGDDLVESKWEMSKGNYTGFKSTGFFKNGLKTGFWNTTFDSKLVKAENYLNGLVIGRYRVYNSGGEILYKTTFGPKGNGIYKDFYYETGKVKEEGNYKNGKKEGDWCHYNKEGKIMTTIKYNEGVPQKEN